MSAIDLENTIFPWYGKTHHMITIMMKAEFKRYKIDLTREQWIILHRLDANNVMSQNDLAKMIFRDKTSLTRIISNMESKNLVRREIDPHDKRIKNVYQTIKGRTIYQESLPLILNLGLSIQNQLDLYDMDHLKRISKKIQQTIEVQLNHSNSDIKV